MSPARVSDSCILCGSRAAHTCWREGTLAVARCTCGFCYLPEVPDHERVSYDSGYFRTNYLSVLDARLAHAKDLIGRVRSAVPDSKVLDVGAGAGIFARAASELGLDVLAIDTSPDAARLATEEVGARVQTLDFFDMAIGGGFGAVFMWDVIEHLSCPDKFIERAFEVLTPGGILVLKTPNVPRMAWSAARIAGVASSTRGFFHIPSHVTFFDRRTLRAIVENAAFTVVRLEPAREVHALPSSRSRLKSMLEGVFWLFARLLREPESLLMVARKP